MIEITKYEKLSKKELTDLIEQNILISVNNKIYFVHEGYGFPFDEYQNGYDVFKKKISQLFIIHNREKSVNDILKDIELL